MADTNRLSNPDAEPTAAPLDLALALFLAASLLATSLVATAPVAFADAPTPGNGQLEFGLTDELSGMAGPDPFRPTALLTGPYTMEAEEPGREGQVPVFDDDVLGGTVWAADHTTQQPFTIEPQDVLVHLEIDPILTGTTLTVEVGVWHGSSNMFTEQGQTSFTLAAGPALVEIIVDLEDSATLQPTDMDRPALRLTSSSGLVIVNTNAGTALHYTELSEDAAP